MRNSLKSDGKLFVRMKSVWIVSFVIIVFTLFSSYNSYNGAYTFIQIIGSIYKARRMPPFSTTVCRCCTNILQHFIRRI